MNFGLVLVLVLVSAVAGASSAEAYSVPWVPPSGGDPAVLSEVISGSVNASVGSIEILTMAPELANAVHVWPCELVQSSAGAPMVRVCRKPVNSGEVSVWSNVSAGEYLRTNATYTCMDGSSGTATFQWSSSAGGFVVSLCGSGPTVIEREAVYEYGVYMAYGYRMVVNQPGSVSAVCSSLGGQITAVSAAGYGSVSVSCPAGSSPVAATVNGESYAIPGYTSNPGLAAACAAGECAPKIKSGGYSCDPTMNLSSDPDWCRRVGNGGSVPSTATCEWQHPTLGLFTLPLADCASWLEGVVGPSVPDPEDSDTGIISEWLQRILDAIKGVKSAVDGVKSGVTNGVGSIVDKLDDLIDAVRDGSSPGTGGGSGPGPAPGPGEEPSSLADKFAPWTDLYGNIAAGFTTAGDCKGPGLDLSFSVDTSTVDKTLYLFDACGPEKAALAAVSRTLMTVALVVAVIAATIRTVASALGLDLRMGE